MQENLDVKVIFNNGYSKQANETYVKKSSRLRSVSKELFLLLLQFILMVSIPSINVLAHQYAVDPDVPHFRRTVASCFQLVINLLPFVGALDRGAAFVDLFPSFRLSTCLRKQTRVIGFESMVSPPVFSSGTRSGTRVLRT